MDTLVESMRKEGNDEAVKVVGRDVGQETSDIGREDAKRHYSWNYHEICLKTSAILEVPVDL